ncbi:hypothetical protein [Stigmatella aurantiaca]|nr:hypothetical protein [Stigmatella aurantiaca]
MKRLLLIAALMMGAPSCVNGNEGIMILGTTPVGPDCARLEDRPSLVRGSMELGAPDPAGVGPSFYTSFNIASVLASREDDTGALNDVYVDEIIFGYKVESDGSSESFDDVSIPISFYIPGSSSENFLILDLINGSAKEDVAGLDSGSTLFVSVKFKGKTSSGSSVQSNEVTYPILIIDKCSNPLVPGACAGPGQCS